MRDGALVSWIEVEMWCESLEALGLGGFDAERAGAAEARGGEAHHGGELLGLEVFHDLGAEYSVQRGFREVLKIGGQVSDFGVQTFMTADCDALIAEVDAFRGYLGIAH